MKHAITLTLLLFLFTALPAFAQKGEGALQLSGGKSWHGTGDLSGFMAEVGYSHNFSRHFNLTTGLTTMIHSGKDNGLNSIMPGASPDESLMRFTTASIQLTPVANFAPLRIGPHKLYLGGGGLVRFQSTSRPGMYLYSQDSNRYPTSFYSFYNREDFTTLSVGYTFGPSLIVQAARNYQVGVKAMFQNDTNSDAITYISLIVGRNVRWAR